MRFTIFKRHYSNIRRWDMSDAMIRAIDASKRDPKDVITPTAICVGIVMGVVWCKFGKSAPTTSDVPRKTKPAIVLEHINY
jgi:hypothetical protein